MPLRRSSDPVFLQHIWNAIESTRNSENVTTFQCILSSVHTTCDPKCTPTKLHRELTNAASDGCVKIAGDQYSLVPGFEHIQKDRSDWYCYECHSPGVVIPCPTCFRVYHAECLSAAAESNWSCRLPLEDPTVGSIAEPDAETPPKHPCPVCKRLQRASTSETTISVGDLQKVFLAAYDCVHKRVNWKTLQKVGYLYEPLRNEYLVYRQINTRMIGERLRCEPRSGDGYPNRTTFLIDLDNLVHNTAVFYGPKHAISNMARQIRSHLRRAMRESTYCIDCYIRPSTLSPIARITAACRKPHRLLWFQHNGWSFRPCKMLYKSAEGYEVVCFGGRHEREFVPLARAFDMTFTAPDLGLRMTPSLKKALDEAEEYKANQSAYDRNLPISSTNARVPRFGTPHPSTLTATDATDHGAHTSGRKRKAAGPKYASAFRSTDTDSVASTISKRAKGRLPSNLSIHSKRKTKANMERDDSSSASKYTERHSLTTTNSDSDAEDSSACSPRWQRKSISSQVERVANCNQSRTAQRLLSNSDFEFHTSAPHKHPGHTASPGSSLSSVPSCTSNTSSFAPRKPVIRIKPLPLPSEESQNSLFSSLPEPPDLGRRQKPKTPTPSPSSALSGPSSIGATIPAIVSVDDLSRDSSLSSASSHLDRPRSSKAGHHSRDNKLFSKKIPEPASATVRPAVAGGKVQPTALGRLVPTSHSPSDSDDDSDSSSSSSTLSDSSTSTVLSSSTTVSSDSTLPSLHTRRASTSTKLLLTTTTTSAFPTSHRQTSDKYRPVTPFVELPTKLSKVVASVASLSTDRSKPDCPGNSSSSVAPRPKQQTTSLEHSKPPTWDSWKLAKHENPSHTSPAAPESVIKFTKGFKSSANRLSTTEPATVANPGSSASSMGPTPPFSSSSSSSWHSSVSPAALSTTSGLGSSLSDPKSVDASPGDGVALLLGCTSFGNQASVQTITTTTESAIYKSAEEHLHRFYNERLALLTAERDQAREELVQRDTMIAKLRTDHEAEIRRVKQLTWCQICLNQAYYHCCPGTAYCSEACQLRHWTEQHNRDCRRQASDSHHQQQQQPQQRAS